MKNILSGINSRLDNEKGKISKFEDLETENYPK